MTETHTVLLIHASPGELLDKLSILDIKRERITETDRQTNILKEYALLTTVRKEKLPETQELKVLYDELKQVNLEIWDYSETIRSLGERGDFGNEFARVSWIIHSANDRRAALKKKINLTCNSLIIEEKSYKNWN